MVGVSLMVQAQTVVQISCPRKKVGAVSVSCSAMLNFMSFHEVIYGLYIIRLILLNIVLMVRVL